MKPDIEKIKPGSADYIWYLGILSALEAVADIDEPVFYGDIIDKFRQDHLVDVARQSGRMRSSGLYYFINSNRARTAKKPKPRRYRKGKP